MADMVERKLYNPHDNLTGRDGGPYLDQVERARAEEIRARVEGREPDLDDPGPVAGTPLVVGAQLAFMANPASNPSQSQRDPAAMAVDAMAVNDDFPVKSVATAQMPDLSSPPAYNPADPSVRSVDEGSDEEPLIVEQEKAPSEFTEPAEPNVNGEPLA